MLDKEKHYLRQTQRGWYRKKELVEIKGGGCQICGYCDCMRAMSFHHRDPKQKCFNLDLRTIGNRKWNIILEEVDKCDLLCMNCHAKVHDDEVCKKYHSYQMRKKESFDKVCLNCGKEFRVRASYVSKNGGKYCSIECFGIGHRRVVHPTKEELEKLLWEIPTTHIAKLYGVSDKAIDKWAKKFKLSKPPRGYWTKVKYNKY